jgi:hypothetical protein
LYVLPPLKLLELLAQQPHLLQQLWELA